MPSGTQPEPIKVFYSYAHEDQELRDNLAKHLRQLKRQKLIVDWYDRCIGAGTEWRKHIDEHRSRPSFRPPDPRMPSA